MLNPETAKILVVEDDADVRSFTRMILKKAGFKNIIEAESGAMAIKKIETLWIDLILLDWQMPNLDGLDVLKLLRARGLQTPVIMVTAEKAEQKVLEAIEAGVDDYIAKPFSSFTLGKKIVSVLTKGRQTKLSPS